jgi:hypothetical protein
MKYKIVLYRSEKGITVGAFLRSPVVGLRDILRKRH